MIKRWLSLLISLVIFLLICSCSAHQEKESVSEDSSGETILLPRYNNDSSKNDSSESSSSESNSTAIRSLAFMSSETEFRAVWISYVELKTIFAMGDGFKAEIDKMFLSIKNAGMNAVIVQVRPFCDAIYPSNIYPWSDIISGTQGVAPNYDPLAYMVEKAHALSLEFHAWINPYRVALKTTDPNTLCKNNFARIWMQDSDTSNDGWSVIASNGIYLNPAVSEVQQKIIEGVREIINNYDIDGIHMDDYFYPTTDSSFDEASYAEYRTTVSGNPLSLDDWRRANVNALINGIYSAVRSKSEKIAFGISPMADISKNRDVYYADISAWLEGEYIDYIMPQLYFGFKYPKDEFQFQNLLKKWINLVDGSNVALQIGLAPYKIGTTSSTEADEWGKDNDILANEISLCYNSKKVSGFAFYSYTALFSDSSLNKAQREKIVSLFNTEG